MTKRCLLDISVCTSVDMSVATHVFTIIRITQVLAFNALRLRALQAFLLKQVCTCSHVLHSLSTPSYAQGFMPEDVPFLLTRTPTVLSASEQRLLRNLQWLENKGAGLVVGTYSYTQLHTQTFSHNRHVIRAGPSGNTTVSWLADVCH